MKGHVEPAAQRNHCQKIHKDQVIEYGILQRPMGHPKKKSKRGQNRDINRTVHGVSFPPSIGGQHADPNHDVGDDDENRGEDGDEAGMSEDIA